MRILLIGEFSRLHNSLKEGLVAHGHEVVIVANGDGFKNYPADLSTKAKWCETLIGNIPRQIIFRLTKFDIATLEFGIRFYFHLNQLKNFDVVQLINEAPIQTTPKLERFLLKKIFKHNKKTFLLPIAHFLNKISPPTSSKTAARIKKKKTDFKTVCGAIEYYFSI